MVKIDWSLDNSPRNELVTKNRHSSQQNTDETDSNETFDETAEKERIKTTAEQNMVGIDMNVTSDDSAKKERITTTEQNTVRIDMNVKLVDLAEEKPFLVTDQFSQQNNKYCESYHDREMKNVPHKNSKRSSCAQVMVALILNLLIMDVGMEIGIATLVIGALHDNSSDRLCMDDAQVSWYGSFSVLFRPVGCLFSGFLQERFGRKNSLTFINIPIFLSWISLYFADSVLQLYAIAIVIGLCNGLKEAPVHSYIGEIAEPRLRGILSTIMTVGTVGGITIIYIAGYLVEWRMASLIASAVPIITLLGFTQIPESPTWLIEKNRLKEAQKSLCWLRGWVQPKEVQSEFEALIKYVKSSNNQSRQEIYEKKQASERGTSKVNSEVKKCSYFQRKLKKVTDKKVMRPLRFLMLILVFNLTTALMSLRPFLVRIINEFGFPVDSRLLMILSPSTYLVGAITNVTFLQRFGKRKLSLFSYGISTVAIFSLGIYCTFFNRANSVVYIAWVPVFLTLVTDFSNGISMLPLPWQLISEIFPPKGRGFAGSISSAWSNTVMFILIKSFIYLQAWIKFSGTMYLYGAISILGLLYHYYFLPETEGKSLVQIESYFTNNYNRKEKFSLQKKI